MGAFSGFASALSNSKGTKKLQERSSGKKKPDDSSGGSSPMPDSGGGGFYGSDVTSYHKGGRVRKTGLARLKKGERVLTKGQQKKLKKRLRSK
jgi:hypothetical protein